MLYEVITIFVGVLPVRPPSPPRTRARGHIFSASGHCGPTDRTRTQETICGGRG